MLNFEVLFTRLRPPPHMDFATLLQHHLFPPLLVISPATQVLDVLWCKYYVALGNLLNKYVVTLVGAPVPFADVILFSLSLSRKYLAVDLSFCIFSHVTLVQTMSFFLPLSLFSAKGFSSNTQTPCGFQIQLSAATTDRTYNCWITHTFPGGQHRVSLSVYEIICLWPHVITLTLCKSLSIQVTYGVHSWTAVVCTFPCVSPSFVWLLSSVLYDACFSSSRCGVQ